MTVDVCADARKGRACVAAHAGAEGGKGASDSENNVVASPWQKSLPLGAW